MPCFVWRRLSVPRRGRPITASPSKGAGSLHRIQPPLSSRQPWDTDQRGHHESTIEGWHGLSSPPGPALNERHPGGYDLPSGPSPPSRRRSVAGWLGAVPARRQCLSCQLDVEAQPRPWTIPQPNASKALGVGVDPIGERRRAPRPTPAHRSVQPSDARTQQARQCARPQLRSPRRRTPRGARVASQGVRSPSR